MNMVFQGQDTNRSASGSRWGNDYKGGFKRFTSLAVYLLGSPVEIHLAGGDRASVRLGRGGGRSGGMLIAHRQSGRRRLRDQAAAAAAAAAAALRGSFFSRRGRFG